jgi:gliding motility associated protien GldN
MKPIYYISFFVLLFAFAQESFAQDQPRRTRQRPSEVDSTSVVNLTERAKIKNEVESQKPTHIVWERLIYRTIDLTKEENNAALYYPVQPQGDRQNLFTLIFKLLADGKISAYNYSDAGEVFAENEKKNFEEVLKTLQLVYTQQGNRFVVDERDIPSSEVTQYMLKEGYYFDQATGTFQTSVIALCPILVREDFYYGNASKETLFWLKYDDIRPYLSREMIMTSNYNNALTYTIDDYFTKNMYTGEIVKTVNMMGKSLAQEVGSEPEALKHAQDSIESQLKLFDEKLWVYNDSVRLAAEKAPDKKAAKKEKTSTSGRTNSTEKKESGSASKQENAAPARSVRRTR